MLTKQFTVAVTSLLQQSILHDKARVPILAARSSGRQLDAEKRRKLQGGESPSAGLLSALLGGESPEGDDLLWLGALTDAADDCGIDIDEMVGKAFAAMSMFGGVDENKDVLDYLGMIKVLKDDDENACGPEEEANISIAIESFNNCSGMGAIFDMVEKALLAGSLDDPLMNDCQDLMSLATSSELPAIDLGDIGDLPGMTEEQSNAARTCINTLLGDNPVGNFVRLQYQNIDMTLQCFHQLSRELPKCVLSETWSDLLSETWSDRWSDALSELWSDGLSEQRSELGNEGIDLPMSLEKKFTCLLSEEILYKPGLESSCIELHAGLDACLPPADQQQNTRQYEQVQECANERSLLLGEIPDMGIAATAITGESIYPSFCTRVAPSLDFSSLDDRITHYNGWVVNEISGNSPEIAAAFGSEQERPASSSESAPSASGMSPTAIGALVLGGLLVMAAIVSQKRAANVSYAQPHDLRRVEMDDLA
mmetsp:Transcript_12630/g.28970  ORF Transcript_12630/g.28970 Transcript_12630/m.28970 type:complete len:482 (-) Transcript_12630:84-1529(-)